MRRTYTLLVALVILAVAVGVYLALSRPATPLQIVPVSLRSALRADYSAGPATPIAPADFGLVATALHDDSPGAADINAQVATLQADLLTPIPTVTSGSTAAVASATPAASQLTPLPSASSTPTPAPTATLPLSLPSLTPLPLPTATLLPTLSLPTVTLLPTLAPTSTLLPLPTLPLPTP